MFDKLKSAIEGMPRMGLGKVAPLVWKALVSSQITEAEADELSNLIEVAKIVPPPPPKAPRKPVGSRPITPNSLARRRRWVASGWLPPALATHFTQGETAVLAVIANTVLRSGDCRHSNKYIAALAGVSHTTVKNAIRMAQALGFLTVEERRETARRNQTNIVRIVSPEWKNWGRLMRPPGFEGGGGKSATCTSTLFIKRKSQGKSESSKELPKRRKKGWRSGFHEKRDIRHGLAGDTKASHA